MINNMTKEKYEMLEKLLGSKNGRLLPLSFEMSSDRSDPNVFQRIKMTAETINTIEEILGEELRLEANFNWDTSDHESAVQEIDFEPELAPGGYGKYKGSIVKILNVEEDVYTIENSEIGEKLVGKNYLSKINWKDVLDSYEASYNSSPKM